MAGHSTVRVVFNYLVFLEALTHEPDEYSEAYEAYQLLCQRQHLLVLSDRIVRGYTDASKGTVLIQPLLVRAGQEASTTRRSIGGRAPRVPGLGSWHRALVDGAILANADYLITRWRPWLDLAPVLSRSFGLNVLAPGEYVRQFS